MVIRECKYKDILSVAALEKECFDGESWSFGSLASAFENPSYHMVVAEEAGEIIGYGCISVVCENCDLENVLVAEAYRRGGIGTALLNALLDSARENGAGHVFLELRVSNAPAMRMYLNSGFTGVYARTRYYSDGEDCLVMKKVL